MGVRLPAILVVGSVLGLLASPVAVGGNVGSADGLSVDRTVEEGPIAFGESVTVELNVTVGQGVSDLTIRDDYDGERMEPFAWEATLRSVRIDGERAPGRVETAVADAEDGIRVRVDDVAAGETVRVTYAVQTHAVQRPAVQPGQPVTVALNFTGVGGADVSTGGATAEFGNDTVRVTDRAGKDPLEPIVGDGTVTDAELRTALGLWVRGEVSDSGLSTAIELWVTGSDS